MGIFDTSVLGEVSLNTCSSFFSGLGINIGFKKLDLEFGSLTLLAAYCSITFWLCVSTLNPFLGLAPNLLTGDNRGEF